jgi:glycosyltransferase involved in cell wall biosynthesis
MKICILTPRFSFPECGGDLLRINNVARHLKKQGHELVLVSYTEGGANMEQAKKVFDKIYTIKRSRWNSLFYSALFLLRRLPIQCGYYYSKAYLKLFKEVISKETPDLYVAHLIRMTPFLEQARVCNKSIVEMTDALSKTYTLTGKAKGSQLKRFMYSLEKHLIGSYELKVIRRYPKVVLVSAADIDFLSAQLKPEESKSLALHTNGVNHASEISTTYDPNKICFLGNMVSLQNQDAALYFVKEIFPKILERKPDARFYILGNNPPKSIINLHNGKNVIVTGFISEMEQFIVDACMMVAPIRIAAGIQNKVLISMANGIPAILTPLIAVPIPQLVDGDNCFVAGDIPTFANRCIQLMDDSTLRNSMGRKGYEMVKADYSWDAQLNGYEII